MKTIFAIAFAVSLAGCAHGPPLSVTPSPVPQHHVKKAAPIARPPVVVAPPVAPPVVAPAPQVAPPAPQAAPSPKQSFKHRWLRLFFRDRALSK